MADQSKNSLNIILIVLLLISLGFNIYQWTSKTDMKETYETKVGLLSSEREEIDKELNNTYAELNQYKGINSRLDSLLQEANVKVDEQKARIDKLIRTSSNAQALNKSLKLELEEIKNLRNRYLEQIDSLLVENVQLKKEKTDLSSTVDSLSKNLESTITTASALKAEYFKIKAYKKRNNNKYTETAIAKRANKIESCFTIMENSFAGAGQKTAYLRVIEPGGKVLGNRLEGSSTFKKAGSEDDLLFTSNQSINFNNQKQDVCLNYEEKDRVFTPGTYLVEIYIDGNPAGVSSIKLR